MEFRLSLMQNEIEHLNKNMGLMSEELIILKEFVRQEFSSRFEAFCNVRKDKQRHPVISNVTGFTDQEQSSSSSSKRVQRPSRGDSQPQVFEIKTEPDPEPEIDDPEFEYNGESGDESDGSDMDFQVTPKRKSHATRSALDPLRLSKSKGGKPKDRIHKYFEHITDSNGKIRTKCYTCQEFVSNQAKRLKNHYRKCNTNHTLDVNKKVIKELTTDSFKRPTEVREDTTVKMGRKLDRVRELFEEVDDDESGFKKMKCLHCGHLASNQPSRMRRHIEKCEGLGNARPLLASGTRRKPSSSSSSKPSLSSTQNQSQPHVENSEPFSNESSQHPLQNEVDSQNATQTDNSETFMQI